MPRTKPDLRFCWVPEQSTLYSLPSNFCSQRHKTPEPAEKCRRKALNQTNPAASGHGRHARLVIQFPDNYWSFFPIPMPPPELRLQLPCIPD